MAVEPLAIVLSWCGWRHVEGRLTPRFRTIQVYPKSVARKHAQALALSIGRIPRLGNKRLFAEV